MKKIEKEMDKPIDNIDIDYVEKFVLKHLKKYPISTLSNLFSGYDVNACWAKRVLTFVSFKKRSFSCEFNYSLDNIYKR